MYGSKEFWNDVKSGKFATMVKESSKGLKIANAEEVYNIMKPLFAEQDDVECFYCIFLNAKNKVLSIEKMFSGSILSASVYPREIVKKVLSLKSTSVILIHNHPSGDTEPSSSDYSITVKIAIALDSIGVCIHDHIIVGNGYSSMASIGKLKTIQEKVTDFSNISIH
ncbi:MAG: JAB domain-containing protein [Desulfobacula sp.]|nr:JAB domain-containing protein [Desulfobacula sp.]